MADETGSDWPDSLDRDDAGEVIELRDTGVRALFTLLFFVIARVAESVLVVVVLFELIWAALMRRPPGERVRQFSNQLLSYLYRIARYLTYNESSPPFPFQDFPPELEPVDDPEELELRERSERIPR